MMFGYGRSEFVLDGRPGDCCCGGMFTFDWLRQFAKLRSFTLSYIVNLKFLVIN